VSWSGDADIDEKLVASLLGKQVLVGLTYLERGGTKTLKQVHGPILRVNRKEGVVIGLPDGSEFSLPPDLSAYKVAKPGTYTLSTTGEIVTDPDLICTWVVNPPTKH
jgi:hypothetical protein